MNRVFVLPVRVDLDEWLSWASANRVRPEVRSFVRYVPQALQRPVPADPVPFSTPRAWTLLSRDMQLAETAGRLSTEERRALAFGRVTPHDAGLFCALCDDGLGELRPAADYFDDPSLLPKSETAMWFVVSRLRQAVSSGHFRIPEDETAATTFRAKVNTFLSAVNEEFRFALLLDQIELWAQLGANEVMLKTLGTVTGMPESNGAA